MKLSIITINLNNRDGLKNTMASVLGQTYKDFEYIVIDGGSTDGSQEVIRTQQDALSAWLCEPDEGIYHAMNKGIQLAKSTYLLFLNSGDVLLSQTTLSQVIPHLLAADIVYGDLKVFDKGKYEYYHYPDKLSFSYFVQKSLAHPSTFIKKSLFDKVGLYDQRMLICADWAFFIRAIGLFQASYQHIDITTSIFNTEGISCRAENLQIMRHEHMQVLKDDFSFFDTDYESYADLKESIASLRRSKPYKILKFLGLPKYQA